MQIYIWDEGVQQPTQELLYLRPFLFLYILLFYAGVWANLRARRLIYGVYTTY